jgi:hypothetical protein
VRDLQQFTKALESRGVTLTQPYRVSPEMNNIGTATIVDPWGTVVELTEGLDKAL